MKKRRRGKKKDSFVWGYVFLGFALGLLLAAFLFRYWGTGGYAPKERLAERPASVHPPGTTEETLELPKVAIVIDDMGHDITRLRDLFEVNADITVAVLPNLRYSRDVSREAHMKGWEVLLHLPMEPKDTSQNDPGVGALSTLMKGEDVKARVEEVLVDVPHAIGINNHMGSKFTEDEVLMRAVFDVVKERGMFFLDSRTTSSSVASRLAEEMGVREVDRNVFLDNNRNHDYIKGQLQELVRIARKRGKAVGIGHPYPETIDTLKGSVEEIRSEGVAVVRLSELIE